MRNITLLWFLLLSALSLPALAQDNPCTAVNLPNNMTAFQQYTTQGMTNSPVPYPGCGAPVNADVWFAVVAPPSGQLDIATLPGTLVNAAMAFYQGPCSNLTLLECTNDDNCGNTIMPILQMDNLIPGVTYYIRIWPEGGTGTFQIRVSNGPLTAPPLPLIPVGSAFADGPNCMQLTTAVATQAGCGWFPNQVNFSQPFSQTILMNFGSLDATGADGICMVFHRDPAGTNVCGVGGGGIASEGILNSFIIEFDTWDNSAASGDLPQDHMAINVNGNMAAPIAGPVPLPNIEDNQDHLVSFSWTPGTNTYAITFDGIPMLSGTYNIVANCFGGNPLAWSGYTASTGGSVNNQSVCTPAPPIFPAGSEVEVDAEICQGELYFAGGGWQGATGIYYDFLTSWNGCDSNIITNLTVNPSSFTGMVEIVCQGECIPIGNNNYCNSGTYQVTMPNYLGCDSIISLSLLVLNPDANIAPPPTINCNNSIVTLDGSSSVQGPGMTYLWTGPSPGCIQSPVNGPSIAVSCPGVYTLTVTHTAGTTSCSNTTTVTAPINVETISLNIPAPDTLTCTQACTPLLINTSAAGPNYSYQWTGPQGFTSSQPSPTVCEPGLYILTIENTLNGCSVTASVTVVENATQPQADAGPDGLLSCANPLLTLQGSDASNEPNALLIWLNSAGIPIDTAANLPVNTSGTYILLVQHPTTGCSDLDTVFLSENFNTPFADAGPDQILDCTVSSTILDGSGSDSGSGYFLQWLDPDGDFLGSNPTQPVSEPGLYTLTVTDLASGCSDTAQALVSLDADAPVSDAGPDATLTCSDPSALLNGSNSSVGPGITHTWFSQSGSVLGNTLTLSVNMPGNYFLVVVNTANNCADTSSVLVAIDTMAPQALTGPDQILTCANPDAILGDPAMPPASWTFEWLDASGNTLGNNPTLPVSTPGLFTLLVENTVNGCTQQASVEVTADQIPPLVQAGPNGELTCINTSFLLQGAGSSTGPGFTLAWTDAGGNLISNTISTPVDIPGTYTLTVLNTANGCQSSDQAAVTQDLLAPTAQAGPDQVLNCYNPTVQLNGSLSTSQGSPLFQWLDSVGAPLSGNVSLSLTTPGLYQLLVTDPDNGCTDLDTALVTANFDTPSAAAGSDLTLDCNSSQVLLDGSASSSGPDILYTWTNSNGVALGNDPTLGASQADIFTLTVLNTTSGCSAADQAAVLLDANAPLADAGPNDTLTCTVLTVVLDGGNSSSGPGFSAQWTDALGQVAGTDLQLVTAVPGIFTLTITNLNNGCASSNTAEVVLNNSIPTADAGSDLELTCTQPDALAGGIATSSGPAFIYAWTDQNGIQVADTPTLPVNLAGIYTLTVTNTGNNCSANDQVMVSEDFTPPTADAGPDALLNCNQPDALLDGTASSSGPDFTYSWTDAAGNLLSANPSLPVAGAGVFTLTIVNTDNGCNAFDQAVVTVDFATPVADAGPNLTLTCSFPSLIAGGTATSAGQGIAYQWTDGLGNVLGADSTLPIAAAGTYTLLVTNTGNGCTDSDQVSISEDLAPPLANAGADVLLNCFQPASILNGSGSATGASITYQWTDAAGNTLGADLVLAVSTPGLYTLEVLNNQNGCSSQDQTVVTTDFTLPIVNAGVDLTLTCTQPGGTLLSTGSSAGPGFSYLWENAATGQDLGTGPSLPVSEAGIYQLTILNTLNGCSATDQVSVAVDQDFPIAVLAPPALLTCIQTLANLDGAGSSTGPEFDYTWTSSVTPTADPLLVTTTLSGFYQLIVVNTANGCADTATVEVLQDIAPPVADAGADLYLNCFQPTDALDGSASSPAGLLTFLWTTVDGQIDGPASAVSPEISAPGTYQLQVTNVQNGCTDSDFTTATASFLEDFSVETTPPLCFGDRGALAVTAVSGGVPPYLYSVDGGQTFVQSADFPDLPSGNYQVVVQDSDGCTLETFALIPTPLEVVVFLEAEVEVQLGQQVQLNAQPSIPINQIGSVTWTPAEGLSCSDCLQPFAQVVADGAYTVEVTDLNGCAAHATVVVRVNPFVPVFVPNIFSPNFDGINDVFTIFSSKGSVKTIRSMQLFSRWGEKVFEGYNFPPDDLRYGWDGTWRGKQLDPAVFTWLAEVEFADGRIVLMKGDVTLVR